MKTETLGHRGFIFSVRSDIWWIEVVLHPLKGEGLSCCFTLFLKKNPSINWRRGESEVEEMDQILMEI